MRLATTLTASLFFISALTPVAHGEAAVAEATIADTETKLFNASSGKQYKLSVSLPDEYDASETTKYPVLYVLDGNMYFATTVQSYRVQRLGNDVVPMIIVGIEYPTRSTDAWLVRRAGELSPTSDPNFDQVYTEQYGIEAKSGGAAAFRETLVGEIIPEIEKTYSTSAERGLFGHSLGGLFASYDLLATDRAFTRYAISSPSLWWDNEVALGYESTFAEANTDLDVDVFLSVGSLEGPQMVPGMVKLDEALTSRSYPSLDLTAHIFEDETHLSVQPAALSRALRVLFAPEDE